jgi:hypothetical protein
MTLLTEPIREAGHPQYGLPPFDPLEGLIVTA